MVEILEAPPAAKTVYEYLASHLDVPAAGLIPNPRPKKFVRVRSGGGSDKDVAAAQPYVYVECYATKIEDAEALSRRCDALLLAASRSGWLLTVPVRSIAVISLPQELPDPITEMPRFTATYAPILHRTAVTVP